MKYSDVGKYGKNRMLKELKRVNKQRLMSRIYNIVKLLSLFIAFLMCIFLVQLLHIKYSFSSINKIIVSLMEIFNGII